MVFICLDGCGPEYLDMAEVPNIKRLAGGGCWKEGSSVIPSVTNVNNVSIITGTFPCRHGITTNYCYNAEDGSFEFMESADYLLAETVLELAKSAGLTTGLLTSKLKLLNLLKRGADTAFSAEDPPPEYIEDLGSPPEIYSMEINLWLFEAAFRLIRKESPDLLYVSTTDYTMHKHAPGDELSLRHLNGIDRWLGEIMNYEPEREIYITADHGMNPKKRAIDLRLLLKKEGIPAEVVPIIKDRYVAHHQNMGGAAYIYLLENNGQLIQEAAEILRERPEVEEIYTAREAGEEFGLHPSRIGDLMVLAPEDTVYGSLEELTAAVEIRSHGSRYESAVPLISSSRAVRGDAYRYNLDLVKNLTLKD